MAGGTLADLYASQNQGGTSTTMPTMARRGAVIGSTAPLPMSVEQMAYERLRQAGVNTGAQPSMPANTRTGVMDGTTAAAINTAGTLGLNVMDPRTSQPMQAPGGPGGNTAIPTGAAAGAYAEPRSNINTAAAGPVPGAQQGIPGLGDATAPGGTSQQLTPQAQAMIAQLMRQRAMAAQQQVAQRMADQRGVFAGQQQATQMPQQPQMPAPPVRRGPPVGPVAPNPYGPR